MARTSPGWRKIRTALAALVLTLLTLGPSLDGVICRDEGGLSAAAGMTTVVHAMPVQGAAPHSDDGPGLCVHGHCHHGAAYAPMAAPAADAPGGPIGVAGSPRRERVRTANPQFGLMRPPRA